MKNVFSRYRGHMRMRFFENEVPEVYDGLITIVKVVREPGERAKVAVESYDDRIDPVGAGGVGAGFLERSTFPKTRIPSNFGASEAIFSTTGSGAFATGAGVTFGS